MHQASAAPLSRCSCFTAGVLTALKHVLADRSLSIVSEGVKINFFAKRD